MWVIIALVIVAVLAWLLLSNTPEARLRKAEAAIVANNLDAATEQLKWLLERRQPDAPTTLARLHLVKAERALNAGTGEPALHELQTLYGIRARHTPHNAATLAEVEASSGETLAKVVEELARPKQKAGNWDAALKWYEAGLAQCWDVAALLNGAHLEKLEAGAVRCHEQLLSQQISPLKNSAAAALGQEQFDRADQELTQASVILKGPHNRLKEKAAAQLRPTVQVQLAASGRARRVAAATQLTRKASLALAQTGRPAVTELTQVLSDLQQAQELLTEAGQLTPGTLDAAANNLAGQVDRHQRLVYRKRGEQYEQQRNWVSALQDYKTARQLYEAKKEAEVVATLDLRCSLVAIKSCKGSVITDAKVLKQAEAEVRIDLAYRAAVSYLRAGRYETAALFVPHLAGLPVGATLAAAVAQQEQQALHREVETLVATAQREGASFQELQQAYQAVPGLARRVGAVQEALGKQVSDLTPLLLGRLLTTGLAQQELEPLLKLLVAQPEFLRKPDVLRNVGIVCLRLATGAGQLTTANYQQAIGLWLTALYSNKVLLASLDSTSWDDDLNFTLVGSLGICGLRELPENVSQEESDGQLISLGDTQRELQRAFEEALHRLEPAALQTQATTFYDEQRRALEDLIREVDWVGGLAATIEVASPHTAVVHGLNQPIVNFLITRYEREQRGELLDYARPYHGSLANPRLVAYEGALDTERQLLGCFAKPRSRNLTSLPQLLARGQMQLAGFGHIAGRVQRQLVEEIRKANQEEPDGSLVKTFEALVAAFPTHEAFKVLGAGHICDWCVGSLNDKEMKHLAALPHLLQGWNWVPDDQRLAGNLCIVFGIVCQQDTKGSKAQQEELAELERVVAQVARTCTRTMRQQIREELLPTQREVFGTLGSVLDLPALLAAAQFGYSSRFTDEGMALGKKLLVLQKMTKLAD